MIIYKLILIYKLMLHIDTLKLRDLYPIKHGMVTLADKENYFLLVHRHCLERYNLYLHIHYSFRRPRRR